MAGFEVTPEAKEFQSELEMIDSDINSLEQQAGQLVSEIQKK
jgi:hypothetical protein